MPALLLPFALRGEIGYISGMADAVGKLRWFRLAPHHCLATLLAVEGSLWLSNRLGWPSWHKGYAVLTAVAAVALTMLLMLFWFGVALLFRWRFQFGIRSLLVLTVAVALPCSWFSWEMQKAREQNEAAEAVRKAGLSVGYDLQCGARGHPGLRWLYNLLGDDFFSDVDCVQVPIADQGSDGLFLPVSKATDQDLLPVKTFRKLRFLRLAGTSITDSGMACAGDLRELQSLDLCCTNVGDKGIAHLRGLGNLRVLNLSQTKVTNSGLVYLKDLPRLEVIILVATAVDDNGLLSLAECRRLKEVDLLWRDFPHWFTPEGIARFKRAMPNCLVIE
jgi:hypothetical protein